MAFVVAVLIAVLFLPSFGVARVLWRKLSRPQPSERYLVGAAVAVITGFLAVLALTLFVLSFGINGDDFGPIPTAPWLWLGLSCGLGVLTLLFVWYCGKLPPENN